MKKIYKIFLIIAVGLMSLGVVVAGGALIASGFDWDKFTISKKDFSSYHYDQAEKDVPTYHYDHIGAVKMLYIDEADEAIGVDLISVVPSPDDVFHAYYYGRNEDDIIFNYNAEKEALTIKANERKSDWRDHVGFYNLDPMPLEIQVPASVESLELSSSISDVMCSDLDLKGNLTCESDGGVLTLKNIMVQGNADISADVDNVLLDNVQAALLEVSSDTGDIWLNAVSVQSLDLETDVGDVTFTDLKIERELSLDTDGGDIEGSIDGSRNDFTAVVKTDFSDCNVENGGTGSKALLIHADVGDVSISFLK